MLSRQLVDFGIPADFYHSQLPEVDKVKSYLNWMEGISLVWYLVTFLCDYYMYCRLLMHFSF